MPEPAVASRMKTRDPSCLFTCSHSTEAVRWITRARTVRPWRRCFLYITQLLPPVMRSLGSPTACFHEGHQAQGSSHSSGSLAGCQLQRGAQWSADFST